MKNFKIEFKDDVVISTDSSTPGILMISMITGQIISIPTNHISSISMETNNQEDIKDITKDKLYVYAFSIDKKEYSCVAESFDGAIKTFSYKLYKELKERYVTSVVPFFTLTDSRVIFTKEIIERIQCKAKYFDGYKGVNSAEQDKSMAYSRIKQEAEEKNKLYRFSFCFNESTYTCIAEDVRGAEITFSYKLYNEFNKMYGKSEFGFFILNEGRIFFDQILLNRITKKDTYCYSSAASPEEHNDVAMARNRQSKK